MRHDNHNNKMTRWSLHKIRHDNIFQLYSNGFSFSLMVNTLLTSLVSTRLTFYWGGYSYCRSNKQPALLYYIEFRFPRRQIAIEMLLLPMIMEHF